VELVDAAPDYFAWIRRYQVTRSQHGFPAIRPTGHDRSCRRWRTLSQRHADRQKRRQASLGQWREERGVGTVLWIEVAIFPDKQYEGRSESADIPIEYKLLRWVINPTATGCGEFQKRSAYSMA
jgi:hypothetical protein